MEGSVPVSGWPGRGACLFGESLGAGRRFAMCTVGGRVLCFCWEVGVGRDFGRITLTNVGDISTKFQKCVDELRHSPTQTDDQRTVLFVSMCPRHILSVQYDSAYTAERYNEITHLLPPRHSSLFILILFLSII